MSPAEIVVLSVTVALYTALAFFIGFATIFFLVYGTMLVVRLRRWLAKPATSRQP